MMRTIFILAFTLLLSGNVYGQEASTAQASANIIIGYTEAEAPSDYKQTKEWKKFKRQRAWGWTALGVGSAMVFGGSLLSIAAHLVHDKSGFEAFDIIPYAGVTLIAASIPTLVIAYKHKRKAKNISLTASSLWTDLPNGSRQRQPTIGLCLYF